MLAPVRCSASLIFFVYPLVATVYFSFTRFDLLDPPQWVGLRNYEFLFTRTRWSGTRPRNTLWLVVIWCRPASSSALVVGHAAQPDQGAASAFYRTLFYLPALVPAGRRRPSPSSSCSTRPPGR